MASYQVVVGLVFVAIVGIGMLWLHQGIQSAEVTLRLAPQGGVSLQKLLVASEPDPKDRPVIVVAASGGGTRAAVYTAAVLEGIARRGAVDRVVLGSGVSGGGAALSYFAGHRKALVEGRPESWKTYFDTMTEPFIQDVLLRASEWKMVSSGRLGMALAESFEQRWHLPADRTKLVDVKDMGLILNTALAGHFERPQDAPANLPLHDVEREHRDQTLSTLAGGRLLLTNLALPSPLAGPSIDPDPRLARLPVVIRSEQTRLEEAAALNANFPPVFSNAAIDVDDATRYWVTDGGAVDNRGMEMLLYAVRDALRPVQDENLPRLHIVVADASAFSSEYSQDRGVSTMAGGGARYASHLNAELVAAIRARYAKVPDRFTFSYVMLPDILRRSGSFGTHWMLQDRIEVHAGADKETVTGQEMVRVIRAMHSGDTSGLSGAGCRVLAWSRQDAGHRDGWNAVVKALGGSDAAAECKPATR